VQLGAKQGRIYCGVELTDRYNTPVCVNSELDASVGGCALFSTRGNDYMSRMQECKGEIEAELGYDDGETHHIISHAKEAELGGLPDLKGDELKEYIIAQADIKEPSEKKQLAKEREEDKSN
jgi:hypothetical protein